jgi:hypothetical protein
MGLNRNGTRLILYLKSTNLDFGKVLTLGRQGLHLSEEALKTNLSKYGFTQSAKDILNQKDGYCEPFFKLMGAQTVDSIDASPYENATIMHDLNVPIPDNFKQKYSVVIDGGTLEHVFNFPVALKNCMELLAINGHYIGFTPTNNFVGHGFYQFSPELYYNVFNKDNGFEVLKILFYADRENTTFYEVAEPYAIGERVILANRFPSYLFILARKIENKPIYLRMPQQSDYKHILWENKEFSDLKEKAKINFFKRLIPKILKHKLKVLYFNTMLIMKMLFQDIGDADKKHFIKIKSIL